MVIWISLFLDFKGVEEISITIQLFAQVGCHSGGGACGPERALHLHLPSPVAEEPRLPPPHDHGGRPHDDQRGGRVHCLGQGAGASGWPRLQVRAQLQSQGLALLGGDGPPWRPNLRNVLHHHEEGWVAHCACQCLHLLTGALPKYENLFVQALAMFKGDVGVKTLKDEGFEFGVHWESDQNIVTAQILRWSTCTWSTCTCS